ncbi:DUF418 domain-containing protein [Staphylococcus massiliensis]|uniref:DUF418 domain-containing protein n=1 Tax=Staphylococcus massiliensis TaxID=555791 RepID=UPI001EDEA737|nr:DUF418 domain-containing protein [Staphylococcus massiliensis]MCG3412024.1 DUF418 domain-containing protein [Staphylococcus massiliensis]
MTTSEKNLKKNKRIHGLDLARGTMLLFIILAHVPIYVLNPYAIGLAANHNVVENFVDLFMYAFVTNRSRNLFACLFGYGLILSYNKRHKDRLDGHMLNAKGIQIRSYILIVMGILLITFVGGLDILMSYGIAGLILLGVLKMSPKHIKKLIIWTTVISAIYVPIIWSFYVHLAGNFKLNIDFAPEDTYFTTFGMRLLAVPMTPIVIHVLLPVIPPILIGMWMAKEKLLVYSKENQSRLKKYMLIGLAITVIGALPLVFVERATDSSLYYVGFLFGLQVVTGYACGLFFISLFGLIGPKVNMSKVIPTAIAAMGKRSLTFYILHETIIVILLSPLGLNLSQYLNKITLLPFSFLMWCCTIALAYFMEKKGIKGPFETFTRKLMKKGVDKYKQA